MRKTHFSKVFRQSPELRSKEISVGDRKENVQIWLHADFVKMLNQ